MPPCSWICSRPREGSGTAGPRGHTHTSRSMRGLLRLRTSSASCDPRTSRGSTASSRDYRSRPNGESARAKPTSSAPTSTRFCPSCLSTPSRAGSIATFGGSKNRRCDPYHPKGEQSANEQSEMGPLELLGPRPAPPAAEADRMVAPPHLLHLRPKRAHDPPGRQARRRLPTECLRVAAIAEVCRTSAIPCSTPEQPGRRGRPSMQASSRRP